MSLTFTQSIFRTVVAKICNDVGWNSAHVSTLNVLADVLNFYLKQLSKISIEAANHAGRQEPTLEDMAFAFKYMSIDLSQLHDYILNVESSPLEFEVPCFPLSNQSNRLFKNWDPDEERPEYYYEWLPSLNCTKIKSLEFESINDEQQKEQQQSNPVEIIDSKEENKRNLNEKIEENSEEIINNNTAEEEVVKTKNENETATTPDEDPKTKLVFKFSLGKSLEENVPDTSVQNQETTKVSLSQANTSNHIVNHLMTSKAYLRFSQNSSFACMESTEIRQRLRFPDAHRLPDEHKSRENSPEPEPENPDLVTMNGSMNIGNSTNTIVNNLDDLNVKNLEKILKKKPNRRKKDIGEFGSIKPNIKVKEIGKKERNNNKDDVEKVPRPKKPKEGHVAKPFSIKVTGFGLANEDKLPPNLNESQQDAVDYSGNIQMPIQTTEKVDKPAKKRQYKRKEKPKDGDASEPKAKKMKKSKLDSNNQLNRKDAILAATDFVPSPKSESSNHSRLLSPKAAKKGRSGPAMETFDENEMSKITATSLLEPPNDETGEKGDMDSLSNSSADGSFSTTDNLNDSGGKQSGKKNSNNRTNNANNKRNKGVYSKKPVKSAEVIESSGDSSSDSFVDDEKPVSLLVHPELTENFDEYENNLINDNGMDENPDENMFKLSRHASNSSLSSLSSSHSVKQPTQSPSFANVMDEEDFVPNLEPVVKHHKSSKNNDEEYISGKSSRKSGEEKFKDPSKPKKSKKHSKNKHRHGEEKQSKKHKRSKDKDKNREHKDKEDRGKSHHKDKEKGYKPKLNIKFAPDSNLLEHPVEPLIMPPSPPPQPMIVTEKVKSSKHDGNKAKKQRSSQKIKSTSSSMIETTESQQDDDQNELVFIKDTTAKTKTKEKKNKKNKIITVGKSLLEEMPTAAFASKSSKSKDSEKDKMTSLLVKDEPSQSSGKSKEKTSKSSKSHKSHKIGMEERKLMSRPNPEPQVAATADDDEDGDGCLVYRETIEIESNYPEKLWTCPSCQKPDIGIPMIGCDSCDNWYHYNCVGIVNDPNPEDIWFCPPCKEKEHEKKQSKKHRKKKEKQSKSHGSSKIMMLPEDIDDDSDIVTITPVMPNVHEMKQPTDLTSSVSIYSIPGTSSQMFDFHQASAKNRPRGRPRKDSVTTMGGSKQQQQQQQSSSITITPIAGTSRGTKFSQNEPNYLYDQQQRRNQKSMLNEMNRPTQKTIKETCPVCQSVTGPGQSFDMIACDSCKQWYHWPCVGINNTPSPDSSWFCTKCSKKKSDKRLWNEIERNLDIEPNMDDDLNDLGLDDEMGSMGGGVGGGGGHHIEYDNQCVSCKPGIDVGENAEWICCDFCNVWYHFQCEKVKSKPNENENWFCHRCIRKQRNIFRRI